MFTALRLLLQQQLWKALRHFEVRVQSTSGYWKSCSQQEHIKQHHGHVAINLAVTCFIVLWHFRPMWRLFEEERRGPSRAWELFCLFLCQFNFKSDYLMIYSKNKHGHIHALYKRGFFCIHCSYGTFFFYHASSSCVCCVYPEPGPLHLIRMTRNLNTTEPKI